MEMRWVVDGTIELSEICTAARWRGAACIAALQSAGLSFADAELYTRFAFGTEAAYARSVGEESLTEAEYARLSVGPSGDGLTPVRLPV